MIRLLQVVMLTAAVALSAGAQSSDFYDYIDKYKKIAVKEMERAGIPASIKLAQAILESNAGKSELARKANNHFGIKCHTDWDGKTFEKEDDDYDDEGNLKKSCFRKYKSGEDSYIAHSEFLRDPKKANRYGFLFRLEPDDYKRWARGLRTSGYATGAGYDDKLVRIIETYELFKFDRLSSGEFPDGKPEKPSDIIAGLDVHRVNDVKVVFAKNKVTPQQISLLAGVSIKSLEKYNERPLLPLDTLADDTRIYLQPKRCGFRGKQKWHYVAVGESMYQISQLYGVKLSRLYKRNRMPEGSEAQPDERIKLKGICKVKESERPRLLSEPKPTNTVPVLVDEDDDFMDDDLSPDVPTPTPTKPPVITEPEDETQPTPTQPIPEGVYHTVVKGETLYGISKRYGTTLDNLMQLNNLTGTTISIGQVLRVK